MILSIFLSASSCAHIPNNRPDRGNRTETGIKTTPLSIAKYHKRSWSAGTINCFRLRGRSPWRQPYPAMLPLCWLGQNWVLNVDECLCVGVQICMLKPTLVKCVSHDSPPPPPPPPPPLGIASEWTAGRFLLWFVHMKGCEQPRWQMSLLKKSTRRKGLWSKSTFQWWVLGFWRNSELDKLVIYNNKCISNALIPPMNTRVRLKVRETLQQYTT